jgi:hypothetical protein
VKHYRVTTASGEYTWEGSPEEIVKAMAALDWEGGQSDFMTRVRERVSRGFQLPMVVTDSPLTFLQELDRLGLIKLKPAPMRISPNYTVDDWKRIDLSQEAEWRRAVEIFADRIQGRFLVPISKIEKNYEYGGFAVLALDCLLIETLQQFRMGKAKTPPGEGGEYFTSFLTETSFGEFFNQEMAKMFYQQFRNGILHQAEVKGTSRIRITENLPLVSPTLDGKGLVINRKRFHKQLVQEFKSYMDKLKNPTNRQLQKNFKKKMDYICRGA